MNQVKIIRHDKVTSENLLKICELKMISWPYPIESQLDWIKKNFNSGDLHFLLFNAEVLEAYLNFIQIEIIIDREKVDCYGIGNVCSRVKGKGFGAKIMIEAGRYMTDINRIGLLFCQQHLVGFYSKFGWKIVDNAILDLGINNISFETMIYGAKDFSKVEYYGRQF